MNQLSPWDRISAGMLPGCWVTRTAPRSYLRPSFTQEMKGPSPWLADEPRTDWASSTTAITGTLRECLLVNSPWLCSKIRCKITPASASPCAPRICEMSTTHSLPSDSALMSARSSWLDGSCSAVTTRTMLDRAASASFSCCLGSSCRAWQKCLRSVPPFPSQNLVDQLAPLWRPELLELGDVLVILAFGRYHQRNYLRGLKLPDVEPHLVDDKRPVELARSFLVGENDQPVLQRGHVTQSGPALVVWPVVLAVGIEDDRSDGRFAAAPSSRPQDPRHRRTDSRTAA